MGLWLYFQIFCLIGFFYLREKRKTESCVGRKLAKIWEELGEGKPWPKYMYEKKFSEKTTEGIKL